MPDNGIALERREAPGPTSLGPRARKRQPLVTGTCRGAPRTPMGSGPGGDPLGGASRRSIASFERDGKRETAGRPGRPNSKPGAMQRVCCAV